MSRWRPVKRGQRRTTNDNNFLLGGVTSLREALSGSGKAGSGQHYPLGGGEPSRPWAVPPDEGAKEPRAHQRPPGPGPGPGPHTHARPAGLVARAGNCGAGLVLARRAPAGDEREGRGEERPRLPRRR